MISLEERYILKSFGYIRREWRNGRWRYWYDDIRGKIVEGKYGKVLKILLEILDRLLKLCSE